MTSTGKKQAKTGSMRAMKAMATAFVLASTVASAASAAGTGDDPARLAAADESLRLGLRFFNQGDYSRALLEFSKGNFVYQRGSLLRNMGLCEMKLGRPLDALKHFRAALVAPDYAEKPEQRALAQRELDEAYAQTAHIQIAADEGASIEMDGLHLGAAPKEPIDVIPGKYTLEAHLGAQSAKADVNAPAGAPVTVDLHIRAAAAIPPPPLPVATTTPPAINGDLPAVVTEQPVQRPFWTTQREIGAILGGGALIALGVGGYLYVQADSAHTRAENDLSKLAPGACSSVPQPTACVDLRDAYDSRALNGTWAGVLIGVGALGVAAGAAVFFWPSKSTGQHSASVVPLVSPNSGGFQIHGEF